VKDTSIFLFLITFAMSLTSCKSQSNSVDNNTVQKEMLEKGFTEGKIVDYSKEDGCSFLIKEDKSGDLLLPLKLEDEFLIDNQKIWFKYQYSRRQQGSCLIGKTITLGEIQIRK